MSRAQIVLFAAVACLPLMTFVCWEQQHSSPERDLHERDNHRDRSERLHLLQLAHAPPGESQADVSNT